MKNIRFSYCFVAIACCIAGCNSAKPLPKVQGTYRPINDSGTASQNSRTPRFFDLKYRGTAHGALIAIQDKQGQLTVLPPRGREITTKVDLDLHQVSLESAIKILALQGGNTFQIILKNDPVTIEDTAFVQFLK